MYYDANAIKKVSIGSPDLILFELLATLAMDITGRGVNKSFHEAAERSGRAWDTVYALILMAVAGIVQDLNESKLQGG